MFTQLRLAKRQGLLQGPRLSPVQTYASVALDTVDLRAQWKRDDRQLRLAMLTTGEYDAAELFDEFKEVVTDDDAEIEDDETPTKYVFDNAQMDRSQAEVEREIAEMLAAAASGTASFEEPTFSEWV